MSRRSNSLPSSVTMFAALCLVAFFVSAVVAEETMSFDQTAMSTQNELFTIIGKVNIRMDQLDLENTRILVDNGQHIGFLRADGTFSIPGLPSSSYVVEISSPRNYYEPVRVDITSKGKVRSRRLNLIQPTDITLLRYPLNFESRGYPNYFFKREQFRVMDILLSPMVLMMVVPLLLVAVLPKMVSQDPELQKELENTQKMLQPQNNMRSLSEMMSNLVGGDAGSPGTKKKGGARGTTSRSGEGSSSQASRRK